MAYRTMERAVLISGSPSRHSRSRLLLEHAHARLFARGYDATLVELASLPADALLGRDSDPRLDAALEAVAGAPIVVAGSPVYRATYSGLLKVFFDLLAPDSLAGSVAVPVLTGGSPGHQLALEHGLRPLLASLGATVIATGVYGCDAQFGGGPDAALLERIDRAIDAAISLQPARVA